MDGVIDEVYVYNRALATSSIAALYQSGAGKLQTSSAELPKGNTTLETGLVGHWTFDGKNMYRNVEDVSGSGNTGYMRNFTSTSTATTPGKLGQALKFDGSNDFVSIGDINLTRFSAAAWIYPSALPSAGDEFIHNMLCDDDSADSTFCFRLGSQGQDSLKQRCALLIQDAGSNDFESNANLPLNTWSHCAVTWDGSNVRFYINGTLNRTQSYSGTMNDGTLGFRIGTSPANERFWEGKLDDVRMYNRALTTREVQQLYDLGGAELQTSSAELLSGSTLQSSGLVGHWTFDGKHMYQNVADVSGTGNTGYMRGFTSTTTATTIGKLGQALDFDGINDFVHIIDDPELNPETDLTVSAWVRLKTLDAITVQGGADPADGQFIVFNHNGATACFEGYSLNMGTNNWIWTLSDLGNCSGLQTILESTTPGTTNQWVHLVGTFDRPTARLYVNGVLEDTDTHDADLAYAGEGVRLGSSDDAVHNQFLNGYLDDVRVYNRALSAVEVKRLYNLGR